MNISIFYLLIFTALSVFQPLPNKTESIADLLRADDIDKAEALLNTQPRNAQSTAFRGEIEFRRGNFVKAESQYRAALKMNEKTARAHFGLAKLAMSKLKTREAIQDFVRAISLSPGEPMYRFQAAEAYAEEKNYADQKKQLEEYLKLTPGDSDRAIEARAALAVLAAAGTQGPGLIEAPPDPSSLTIHVMMNLIFTDVTIDGKGPFTFIVDTGAAQTLISEKLADKLALKPIAQTVIRGAGGGEPTDSNLYLLDVLTFKDVKVHNLPVATFNDTGLAQIADGILATRVLSDFIVTVNYRNHRVDLAKTKEVPGETEVLPARYFNNLMLVPLNVEGKGKFPGNFIVDTGAVTTVLSHSMAAKLGVTADKPKARLDVPADGMDSVEDAVLSVFGVTLRTPAANKELFPQLVAISLRGISKMLGTEVSGVMGFDFLQYYKTTLDYHSAAVWLSE